MLRHGFSNSKNQKNHFLFFICLKNFSLSEGVEKMHLTKEF